jgi:hypothetical protein
MTVTNGLPNVIVANPWSLSNVIARLSNVIARLSNVIARLSNVTLPIRILLIDKRISALQIDK